MSTMIGRVLVEWAKEEALAGIRARIKELREEVGELDMDDFEELYRQYKRIGKFLGVEVPPIER